MKHPFPMPGDRTANNILLVIIIGLAILLRCWDYFDLPYITYDEFGVIYSTRLKTFHELLTMRIFPDGHPAGMSVFSYYWIKLGGMDAWWVKLPFIIFGILSVYWTWLIGRKWFNNSVGLLAASYVAFLQYFVLYSQISRPYISGLFFVLLMVNAWTNIVFKDEKKYSASYFTYIIASALCAYNHHFSLLFVLIVGITGLFYCKKQMRKDYLLAGLIIFILYIPHLSILFHQLSLGGLTWLAPPTNDFLIKYLYYAFQYSSVTLASIVLVLLFGGFYAPNKGFYKQRFFIISVIWFLVPVIVGFAYSKWVSPVIQYSMLLFSFPFLLLALFAMIREMKFWQNAVCVSLIAFMVIYGLVFDRQHYHYFYHSLPTDSYEKINAELKNSPKGDVDVIVDCPAYVNYYFQQKGLFPVSATLKDSIATLTSFQRYVSGSKAKKLLYMESNSGVRENYQVIRKYFPNVIEHTSYLGGDYYVFSKEGISKSEEMVYKNSFNPAADDVSLVSSNPPYHLLDSITEYGKSFSLPLHKMAINPNNVVDIYVKVKRIANNKNLILVASINEKDKSVFWGGGNLKDYLPETDQWTWLYYSFKLPDVNINNKDLVFNTYLWNNEKGNFLVGDCQIQVRYGNPVIYSFVEKNLPAFDENLEISDQ
jgi:hypothetical protein